MLKRITIEWLKENKCEWSDNRIDDIITSTSGKIGKVFWYLYQGRALFSMIWLIEHLLDKPSSILWSLNIIEYMEYSDDVHVDLHLVKEYIKHENLKPFNPKHFKFQDYADRDYRVLKIIQKGLKLLGLILILDEDNNILSIEEKE